MIRTTILAASLALAAHAASAQDYGGCNQHHENTVRESIGGLAIFVPVTPDADRWTEGGPGLYTDAMPGVSIGVPPEVLAYIQKQEAPAWLAVQFLHTPEVATGYNSNKYGATLLGFSTSIVYVNGKNKCFGSRPNPSNFDEAPIPLRRAIVKTVTALRTANTSDTAVLTGADETRIANLFPNSLNTEIEAYLKDAMKAMKNP